MKESATSSPSSFSISAADTHRFFTALQTRCNKADYEMWLSHLPQANPALKVARGKLQIASFSPIRLARIERDYNGLLLSIAHELFGEALEIAYIHREQNNNSTAGFATMPLTNAGREENKIAGEKTELRVEKEGALQLSERGPARFAPKNEGAIKEHGMKERAVFKRSWNSAHHRLPFSRHSFDNFVECEENALALNFAKKVLAQFSKNSPLYFFGPVGVGKTHLMHSVMQESERLFPFYKMRYMTPHHFVAEFTASLKAKKDREFRNYYHSLDLLIIDDVQFFMGKEKTTIEFFHLFNTIYAPGKQMLIASDRKPSELGGIDDRLKSRLSSSVVVELRKPGVASRYKILSFYLEKEGVVLDDESLNYIAERIGGDVRKITGFVRTMAATVEVRGRKWRPSLDYCKQLLATFNVHERRKVHFQQVVKTVQDYYKISVADFKGNKKNAFLVNCRQIVAYLLKKHTSLTMQEIGEAMGGRTASTAVYAIEKIERLAACEGEMQATVAEIERRFTELD